MTIDFLKNFTDNPGPKDFPEDYKLENGCYVNTCSICKSPFSGHKRRAVCKECTAAQHDKNGKITRLEVLSRLLRNVGLGEMVTFLSTKQSSPALRERTSGDPMQDWEAVDFDSDPGRQAWTRAYKLTSEYLNRSVTLQCKGIPKFPSLCLVMTKDFGYAVARYDKSEKRWMPVMGEHLTEQPEVVAWAYIY